LRMISFNLPKKIQKYPIRLTKELCKRLRSSKALQY
jgi:hypothetical protein